MKNVKVKLKGKGDHFAFNGSFSGSPRVYDELIQTLKDIDKTMEDKKNASKDSKKI